MGARKLSPVELVDSCIGRIESIDHAVNSFCANSFQAAREQAKQSETSIARGDTIGPLHGLPLGVKDLIDAKGLPTTYGSPLFAGNVATKDEAIVGMLRRAGAIVIGKTNVPKWGAGGNTRNALHGATGNPFDPTKSAAGSSGGSAVALATGMVAPRHRFGHRRFGPQSRWLLRRRWVPPIARTDCQRQPRHGLAADLSTRPYGALRRRSLPDVVVQARL